MHFKPASNYSLNTVLGELHSFAEEVSPETLGYEVARLFERIPNLPGIVVQADGKLLLSLSRHSFFQVISRPFGREIHFKRPVKYFALEELNRPLVLSSTIPVSEAANQMLSRARVEAYEPVITSNPDGVFRVIDAHEVLNAQNQILRETQSALLQSEKLASIGQLAAGVAHEINNPIAFVTNNIEVIRRETTHLQELVHHFASIVPKLAKLDPRHAEQANDLFEEFDVASIPDTLQELFRSSKDGMVRVRDIVRNLSDFGRVNQAQLKRIDINDAIRTSMEMLRYETRNREITINTEFRQLPEVFCQPGKLNQVLLNLMMNAVHASCNGSVISVRTRAESDQSVLIEIEDNGCGISPENLPRIFDPFFTTKPVGKGTGLGLSVCFGIIRDHHGTIDVDSEINRGTIVQVRLPVSQPALASTV